MLNANTIPETNDRKYFCVCFLATTTPTILLLHSYVECIIIIIGKGNLYYYRELYYQYSVPYKFLLSVLIRDKLTHIHTGVLHECIQRASESLPVTMFCLQFKINLVLFHVLSASVLIYCTVNYEYIQI